MMQSPGTSELMLKNVSTLPGPLHHSNVYTSSTRQKHIYTEVPEVSNLVQANVQEISHRRNHLHKKHSLRDIAKVSGMSYSMLYWMT